MSSKNFSTSIGTTESFVSHLIPKNSTTIDFINGCIKYCDSGLIIAISYPSLDFPSGFHALQKLLIQQYADNLDNDSTCVTFQLDSPQGLKQITFCFAKIERLKQDSAYHDRFIQLALAKDLRRAFIYSEQEYHNILQLDSSILTESINEERLSYKIAEPTIVASTSERI